CRRCAAVCPVDAITGEPGEPQTVDAHRCVICGQCVQICTAYAPDHLEASDGLKAKRLQRGQLPSVREPLFAAYSTGQALEVKRALADSALFKVVQCAPAIRVSLAEEFGLPLGTLTPGKMAAALRRV
ncbi:[Fe-Fe] hydrogenase large subunit C-terminal domain-containing protein, partial [Paenibacillus sonchi]|uniref:[Fe-Fe] hydrogenase large subunit C-terminal domain-containing protein n=1 Tax=Paenibacillus sonchi TaxID=373687 RepID=UPI0005844896